MVTWQEYRKHPESYWKGKKMITLREMRNGNFVIPQGTIMEIDKKYQGFSLRKIDTCEKCGIGKIIHITKVEPMAIMLKGE